MHTLISTLQKTYNATAADTTRPDQTFLTVLPHHVRPVLLALRDTHGFSHLSFMTAVDQIEDGQFVLLYMLNQPDRHWDIGLQTRISRTDATMESMHDLWAHLATHQRELYEMFGISFPGSPGMTEDFILEGVPGCPPMRRDFDTLAFAEELFPSRPGRFTHDPAEYKKQRLAEQAAARPVEKGTPE